MMHKDWRLRNSTAMWCTNYQKRDSKRGQNPSGKARNGSSISGSDSEGSNSQADEKLAQKSLMARNVIKSNESGAAASTEVFQPPTPPTHAVEARASLESSPTNIETFRPDSHQESCQQITAEGQAIQRSDESPQPAGPSNFESGTLTEAAWIIHRTVQPKNTRGESTSEVESDESARQMKTAIHLPLTIREIAVHSGMQNNNYVAEDGRGGKGHIDESTKGRNSSPSKAKHVKWERDKKATTIPVASAAEAAVEKEEAREGGANVPVEEIFVQPSNKFKIGGPLHALASLTKLDLSGTANRPGTPSDGASNLHQPGLSPPTPEHPQASHAQSVILHELEPNSPSNQTSNRDVIYRVATSSQQQHSPSASLMPDGQCVLMRANLAYEQFVMKGAQPVSSTNKGMTWRKKIKMKAPVPRQSSRSPNSRRPAQPAASPAPPDVVTSVASIQTVDQEAMAVKTEIDSSIDGKFTVRQEAHLNCQQQQLLLEDLATAKESGGPEYEEGDIFASTGTPDTCVVTHREHSIEVPELQDLPSRRRWPKVSPSFVNVAASSSSCESLNCKDEERSSSSPSGVEGCSSCPMNRFERCATVTSGDDRMILVAAVQRQEGSVIDEKRPPGGSIQDEAKEGRLPENKHVPEHNESTIERLVDNSNKSRRGHHELRSRDTAENLQKGLRIVVPPALVREIYLDSPASMNSTQQLALPSPHPHAHPRRTGTEGKSNKSCIELDSQEEPPPPAFSSRSQTGGESQLEEAAAASQVSSSASSLLGNNMSHTLEKEGTNEIGRSGAAIPEIKRDDLSHESQSSASNVIPRDNTNSQMSSPPFSAISAAADAAGNRAQSSNGRTATSPENTKFVRVMCNNSTSSSPHEQQPQPPSYAERASLSSEKLCSILSYLGHVEESNLQENYNFLQRQQKPSCYSPTGTRSPRTVLLEHDDNMSLADSTFTTTLTNMSNRSATDSNNLIFGDGDGSHGRGGWGGGPAVSLFEGVRKKIQQYKDRIAGQESQNATLLKELERVKADKDQAVSQERAKFGRELEIRAAEYKAAIQHHFSLNEKMVKDKETLSEKCCNLAGNLSTAESKFEEKLKVLQEQAAQDLKKQKELWIAGEKPRREAWKDKKLKEIKEITIKGLEPHIEGIVEKHKQEIQKIETRYADESQKKLELQTIQQRQEMCDLRDRLLKDRDDLLEKERMAALQRMNEVAEKYEQQAIQLRIRVSGDMAAELERAEETRRKDKHEAHQLLSNLQKEAADREDALRKSLEKAMQDAIAKREAEICLLRGEITSTKNEWQKALDERLQVEIQTKEKEIQARCIKERDEQIELIIERMDMEKDEAIEKNQKDLLAKVERLMEEKLDFMKRIKKVESKCASLCQLSLEAKQKAEMELENREVHVASLERDLTCQFELIEQLKEEAHQEKSNLTQLEARFESRIKKEQELSQSALLDVDRCNAEVQQMRTRKAEELAELEAHVRQAIDNKDLVIAGLREQLLTAREQMRHTEMLLS